MKAARERVVSRLGQPWLLAGGLAAAFGALGMSACKGDITDKGSSPGNPSPNGVGGGAGAAVTDPGRVGIHRLNNTEYDNTVRDLFGTTSQPAAMFLAEEGFHFDNTATALGMTTDQYDGYRQAASDLMVEVLAKPAERARFMTCTPTAAADPCARQIVQTFGMQVYRRPLESAEVDRAMKVYDADIGRGQSGTEAIGQTVRAMLSAANFLYRIEYDANPASTATHPLGGYELASRLSYLHWSSMPDAALFDAAKTGALSKPATLEATVDRMLADPKSSAFVESFAGQWLDLRKLATHSIVPQLFPSYSPALGDAMATEGYAWFQEFLNRDRSLSEWFTADFNFVNDALADNYGFAKPGSSTQMTRVEVTNDQRQGFLGLASFLTQTSFPSRTAPTLRGVWVVSELLCDPPGAPPATVPKLDASATPAEAAQPTGTENVRVRLERHRADPGCAVCHNTLDPIGLGLEQFDAIGKYRTAYGNGDTIVPDGMLSPTQSFSGAKQLGALLAADPRFMPCVATQMATYALGREIETYDKNTMDRVSARWAGRGLTLRNLMKEVVLSDAFRFRRGEHQ